MPTCIHDTSSLAAFFSNMFGGQYGVTFITVGGGFVLVLLSWLLLSLRKQAG